MFVLKNEKNLYYKNKGGHRESLEKSIERASTYISEWQAICSKNKLNNYRELGNFKVIKIEIKEVK